MGGACLVYDVTNRSSFEHIKTCLKAFQEMSGPHVVATLVGNMVDLVESDASKRQVDSTEAFDFAKQNNVKFFETSAKTGHNVANVFEHLVDDIYNRTIAVKSAGLQGGTDGWTGGAMFDWIFRLRNSRIEIQKIADTGASCAPVSLRSPECAEKSNLLARRALGAETFGRMWRRISGCLCRQRE